MKERINELYQVFSPKVKVVTKKSWLLAVIASVILLMAAVSSAHTKGKNEKETSKSGGSEIGVNNFGKVTDYYYRGAQPKEDEYGQLAARGIKTIIDLRDDPTTYAKSVAENAGLKYVNLPLSDKSYPAADAADKFLSLVNDKSNWPVYVHCAGGRHRTGAMTAVFRMTVQGWGVEKAYEEMKDYDFYTRWGHKAMKKFVFDYYRELVSNHSDHQKSQLTEFADPSTHK